MIHSVIVDTAIHTVMTASKPVFLDIYTGTLAWGTQAGLTFQNPLYHALQHG